MTAAPEASSSSAATHVTTTATALADQLSSSVPRLDSSGKNWAIFSIRFQDAVEAKGFWGHFDGTEPCPQPATKDRPTPDESAACCVYEAKSAQTELRSRFLDSRCSDKGNVREFLEGLRTKREELATMGVDIEEKDYRSTIISSLPTSLSNFASNQLAAAKLHSATKTIAADTLIHMICEEYERQQSQRIKRKQVKKEEDTRDEALIASSSKNASGGGKGKGRKPRACWTCGEVGHFRSKCPKGKKSEKLGEAANAAVSDSEDEILFFADTDDDEDDVSKAEDEDPYDGLWSSDEEDAEESSEVDWSESNSLVDEDMNLADDSEEIAAQIGPDDDDSASRTEVMDSGCSRHLTLNRDALDNYTEIEPKFLRAADKKAMKAVGKGDMVVELPNGSKTSRLKLKDVFHVPGVGYTLVSIGRLDVEGYFVTFGGGMCQIREANGKVLGTIPRTSQCLYKIPHEAISGLAAAAEEMITLDQFHRRMGHISPYTARKLVKEKLVTGVKLDGSSINIPIFCESCVHAKAIRKPIPKVREGKRASKFGEEVHSDLWGKAPVQTKD